MFGLNKWKIKDANQSEQDAQRICFYCKRWDCLGYYHQHSRIVCSGIWPQWDFLRFLMREIKPTDTCRKFVRDEIWRDNQKQR